MPSAEESVKTSWYFSRCLPSVFLPAGEDTGRPLLRLIVEDKYYILEQFFLKQFEILSKVLWWCCKRSRIPRPYTWTSFQLPRDSTVGKVIHILCQDWFWHIILKQQLDVIQLLHTLQWVLEKWWTLKWWLMTSP